MGNSNKPVAVDCPAADSSPGYMSGARSRQGSPDNLGAPMQYAATGNPGAPAAPGVPAATATSGAPTQLTLAQAQQMALQITTCFEGGKSMNYQALADDFDGQGMSFGLIQWNFGQDTLGPLLEKMLELDAAAFAGCFGPDTNYAILKTALEGDDQAGQLAWARALQRSDKAAWRAAFQAVGAVDAFNAIQREQAAGEFHPLVIAAVDALRLIAPSLLGALEFRSYAALFDLCVQQRSLTRALDAIRVRGQNEQPASQRELLKIAVVERGRLANGPWRSDCISRRMGILTGAPYESTESGTTKKRTNPQLALALQFGGAQIAGL